MGTNGAGQAAPPGKKVAHRRKHDATIRINNKTADLIDNPDQVKDWDEEELRRGYRRNKAGKFSGRPPRVVPTVCYQELTKRKIAEAQTLIRDNLVDAVKVLKDIMLSDFADEGARIKAADMFITRVLGKVPDKIDASVTMEEPKWLAAMREATVVEEGEGKVLDAQATEVLR